jgi:hypothetical protein
MAVTRNVGTYSDPSHATSAVGVSTLNSIHIPQTPKAMQVMPNRKQIHCSIATIVAREALFCLSALFDLSFPPALDADTGSRFLTPPERLHVSRSTS